MLHQTAQYVAPLVCSMKGVPVIAVTIPTINLDVYERPLRRKYHNRRKRNHMKHALQCNMQYSALSRALILVDTYSAFSVVFFNCLCGLVVVKSVDFESKGP